MSFDHVDPLLGGDAALDRLIEAVHAHGLRLVGDLTTNHTGDHHDWFLRALEDPTSPEHAFFRFRSDGSYVAWLDIPSLPKLDHASVELARRLYDGPDSVVARWLRHGLDGWRIDVANMTGRLGADDLAHQVATAIRRTMDQVSPDAWLLAEHGHDASLDLHGPGWHGTMDYAGFTRPLWCWLNGGSPAGPGIPHGLDYLGIPIDIPVLPAEAAVATMRDVHGAMPWTSWAELDQPPGLPRHPPLPHRHRRRCGRPRRRRRRGPRPAPGRARAADDDAGRPRRLHGRRARADRRRRRARPDAVPLGAARHLGRPHLRRLPVLDRPAPRARRAASRRDAVAARRRATR